MLMFIWFVATPVLVLLGALALELMQRVLIDKREQPDRRTTRRG